MWEWCELSQENVWIDGALPESMLAADELEAYLGRAGLLVARSAEGHDLAGPCISFMRSGATSRLGPDGFMLRRHGGTVTVMAEGRRGFLYGAYALLEDLGFRFWAPAFPIYRALGIPTEFVPALSSLPVRKVRPRTERPRITVRGKTADAFKTHDKDSALALLDWMGKQRLNLLQVRIGAWDAFRDELVPAAEARGVDLSVGEHGYEFFINEEVLQDHPTWRGVHPGGTPGKPPVVFCTSQPDAVQYLVEHIVAYVHEHTELSAFAFWPPDTPYWCECDACKERGSIADRHAWLVNVLAGALRSSGSRVRVRCLAYMGFTDPPEHEHLDPEVEVEFCPIARDYRTALHDPADRPTSFRAWGVPAGRSTLRNYETYFEPLKRWMSQHAKVCVYEYYFKYGFRGLPMLMPRLIGCEIADQASRGIYGHATYCEQGTWPVYEVDHYLLARLLWGRELEAELDDYLKGRFGVESAAEVGRWLILVEGAMRRLYTGHGERNFAAMPDVSEAVVVDCAEALEMSLTSLRYALEREEHALLRCWKQALVYAITEVRLKLALFRGDGVAEAAKHWWALLDDGGMRPGGGVVLDEEAKGRLAALYQRDLESTGVPGT